jgi:hypothetical protein
VQAHARRLAPKRKPIISGVFTDHFVHKKRKPRKLKRIEFLSRFLMAFWKIGLFLKYN